MEIRAISGWRATGLLSFNRQQGLKNPFTQFPSQQRSIIPEQQKNKFQIHDLLIPRKPANSHEIIRVLQYNNELMRGAALFMRKTANSIGELQVQLVEKRMEYRALSFENERFSAK